MEFKERSEPTFTVPEVNKILSLFECFYKEQVSFATLALEAAVPEDKIRLWAKLFHLRERALRWDRLYGQKKDRPTLEARAKAGLAAVIDEFLASLEEAREKAKKNGRPAPVYIQDAGELDRLVRLYLEIPARVQEANEVGERWSLLFEELLGTDEEAQKLWRALTDRMQLFEERIRGGYLAYDDEPSGSECTPA